MMDWVWAEWFWVLPGYTWEDYKPIQGVNSPNSADVWTYPFLFMIGLILIRNYFIVPLIFTPIGKWIGIRSKPYRAPDSIEQLDQLYKINRARPPRHLLKNCATEINWTERRVERWLRQKTLSQQMTTLEKFNDYGWQFLYYTTYCIFGLFFVVGNQSWCYNFEETFDNYPRPIITQELWWYYMTALGFYSTQTYLLCVQTRRHDFYRMLLHHGCTISLIIFSWVTNFVRIGAISLLIHECADIPLALGKLINYSGHTRAAELMFLPFASLWIATRLVIYPFHFLRGTLFVLYRVLGIWPAYFLFNILNVSLFFLHLVWTKEIVVAARRKIAAGEMVDDRSSPEEISDDDEDCVAPVDTKENDRSLELHQLKSDTVVRRPAQS